MRPMQHAPVRKLGLAGVITDIPATERTFAQLSIGQNVRIHRGELITVGQMIGALNLRADKTPTYACSLFQSDDSGGHVVCYDDGTIDYIDGTGTNREITPATPPVGDNWYHTQVNDLFVLTNGVDLPYQITQAGAAGADILVPLINWPTNYRAGIIEHYKGWLVAGQILIDGTPSEALVKWSHPYAPGDAQTFWDHTDPTLLAGENPLGVEGREVTAMKPLRDSMIVYFDWAVWRMNYVGGEFVMSFVQALSDDGCVGAHAVTEIDGKAVVIGYRDIYMHDGFSKRSLSDGKITSDFYRYSDITRTMQAVFYPLRREVLMLYSRGDADALDEHNRMLVYNVDANAFTEIILRGPSNLGGGTRLYLGPKFGGADTTYDDAGAQGLTYDSAGALTYNDILSTDENLGMFLLAASDKQLQALDASAEASYSHDPGNALIQVERVSLDEAFSTTGDKIRYLSRLFPRIVGRGKVQISVGTSMSPSQGMRWQPYRDYDVETGHAFDFRAAGRYLGLRIRQLPGEGNMFAVSGFDVELMTPHAGRR